MESCRCDVVGMASCDTCKLSLVGRMCVTPSFEMDGLAINSEDSRLWSSREAFCGKVGKFLDRYSSFLIP